MQKVERKKHREGKHRRILWLAAALLLLAGSVTAAVLLSRKSPEITAPEQHLGMLIDRTDGELVSVTVERRGEEAWTLVRTENGELVPEDGGDWTADAQQGTLLLEAITRLRYEEILTEDPAVYRDSPELFGLEPPLVSVTGCFTDGSTATVRIGSDTGLEEGWHYMTIDGDEKLYAVSSAVVQDLNVEFALLHPVPRPEIYASLLDRITVEDGTKTVAEWTLRGQITDRDAGTNWAVTAPFTCPADEESIQNLKKTAENLRLGVYTAPATAENQERYGFDKPSRILTFHMAAGSTGTVGETGVYDVTDHEESTVVLYVGNARDELADYVRFGDEIYTVSHFTLSAFTEADPMGTAARYPVLTPLNSLESLTVEENGEVRVYMLREKEQAVEAEAPADRECLLDGKEIPYEAFEASYERLLTVTFSGVLPEEAQWKTAYKKYTFRTLSGGTHTVMLSDWDGMHDAVTVDGSTIFYLIRGGMTDLPAEETPTESR